MFVTLGDVYRISEFLGENGFVTFKRIAAEYEDAAGDSTWSSLILQADGSRRILKRTADNSCCFLRRQGCVLPTEVRPLLCRIYPYNFTEEGLAGISAGCPLALAHDWQVILEEMGMLPALALNWHQTLYAEIMEERNNQPNQTSEASPESTPGADCSALQC